MRHERNVWGVVTVLALALVAGCGSHVTYDGAVYADALPMYEKATYRSAMGGNSYGGEDGPSESMSWFFDFKGEPRENVIAFYDKALPGATKATGEGGSIEYTVVPEGAKPGEKMMVIVHDDQIQIHESVKTGP